MTFNISLVVYILGSQGYPINSFLAASKFFCDDPCILRAIKDKTRYPVSRTRLMHASLTGNVERVKLLLSAGEDVNATQKESMMTPLMFACASGHLEIAELLVAAGANVNAHTVFGRTPVSFLCISEDYRSILCRQPITNYGQQTHIASLLISAGADIEIPMWNAHINAWTPLVWASSNGSTDMVAVLLHHGAKDTHGEAYKEAKSKGHTSILELLCSSL